MTALCAVSALAASDREKVLGRLWSWPGGWSAGLGVPDIGIGTVMASPVTNREMRTRPWAPPSNALVVTTSNFTYRSFGRKNIDHTELLQARSTPPICGLIGTALGALKYIRATLW